MLSEGQTNLIYILEPRVEAGMRKSTLEIFQLKSYIHINEKYQVLVRFNTYWWVLELVQSLWKTTWHYLMKHSILHTL